MEILRRTPWSRIRGQNSVYKEFLEIVGNWEPTGNVWNETIAVSATIWISVGKVHHQIRLRILSCGRMSENQRGPEVPEVKAPVLERLDGLARITFAEIAISHSVKNGTLQNACATRPRVVVGLGKSTRSHIVRLMNSRRKSKTNNDKSAVALLKKGDWQERESVTDGCHDRPRKPGKRSDKTLGQNSSKRQFSECTTIWLHPTWEILVDDEIPLQGGSHANSSHEASLEPPTKRREDLGKHNVHTHFPEDRNCEICKRTKITRAPCKRRNGDAVPGAVNFGDLITADHKDLNDNCESRNNHRHAVVVQDLATQWIQAYLCRKRLHKKSREACKSSWNPRGNQKSFTLTIPWNSAKPVKSSPGIIARLHHTDRRLVVMRKEQCAE